MDRMGAEYGRCEVSVPPDAGWINKSIGVVGEARKRCREFVEWMGEQGYTENEIYQLVLVWIDELGPRED